MNAVPERELSLPGADLVARRFRRTWKARAGDWRRLLLVSIGAPRLRLLGYEVGFPVRLPLAPALPAPRPGRRATRHTPPTTRSFAASSASSEQRDARPSRRNRTSTSSCGRSAGRPKTEGRVYLTGGATAVLHGWRESTIDIDIKVVPDSDDLLREIPRVPHPVPTGHPIRHGGVGCQQQRRTGWPTTEGSLRRTSAPSAQPKASGRCAGRRAARRRWCCGCCAASRSTRSPASAVAGRLDRRWREDFLAAGREGLKARAAPPEERELREAQRKIGAQAIEIDTLQALLEKKGVPRSERRSR